MKTDSHGATPKRHKVTLTFDNGPTPEVTAHVLDVLRRQRIRATFFVLGQNIAKPEKRAWAQRAFNEGHWIGNHTYSHSTPLGESIDPGLSEHEIGRTQHLLGELSHMRRLFRPFGGGGHLGPHLLSTDALAYLREGEYTCVLWNAVPRDWENPDGWVEVALEQCAARAWTTLVLHDLPTGAMRHLEDFIVRARLAGAVFTQDFPVDCLPVVSGKIQSDIRAFVAS
jgi:peptidoglycan/xylan/chitin deacetylase (PgdA/CDA1 family)